MGEDCGPWFPQQQFHWQSPNLNYVGSPLLLAQKNAGSLLMNPGNDMVSTNGTLPVCPAPELPNSQVGQANEPHGWFYRFPWFPQVFTPVLNPVLKEKHPFPYDCHKEVIMPKATVTPKAEPVCAQKRFLVFDQSGDQTTLVFNSLSGTPVQCFPSWVPKSTCAHNLNREDHGTKENPNLYLGPFATDEFGLNNGTNLHSEMHEDTEELNALLYSDNDSDYTEDDEITSTGHSPSTMSDHDKQDWFEGRAEEVGSSDGSTKKRKIFDGGCSDLPSLVDTASSVIPKRGFEYEDDAESRCVDGVNLASGEACVEPCHKRIRKERIHETVSILQDIIPGGKGKDAVDVIDEAINYLKSLKFKAKALGFDAP